MRNPVSVTLACILLLCLASLGRLHAHDGVHNNMQITFEEEQFIITMEVALREILLVHGLKDEDQGGLDAEAVAQAATRHETYLKTHLEVSAVGQPLVGGVISHAPPTVYDTPSRTKYIFRIRYRLGRLRPAEVTLRQTMLREFSVTGGHPWHVNYVIRVTRADGKMELSSMAPSQKVSLRTGLVPDGPGATTPSGGSRPAGSSAVGPATSAAPVVVMVDDHDDTEPSWLVRNRIPLAIALVVLGGLGVVAFILHHGAKGDPPGSGLK